MKWELIEPKCGDIIRIRAGNIYHYGVYVSDDEVIQFGVAPNRRGAITDSEVEVLSTDINEFLNGEFLEVGVLDKKEQKNRVPVNKTVEMARGRLGERGYNILYNNCEHFATECVTGVRKCDQADSVRDFFRNLPIVDVYVGVIPKKVKISSVYPKERAKEIKSCSNERVRTEKYCAWHLLEYALHRTFGVKIKDLDIVKKENGKWECKTHCFSISHTYGAVAVCVSRAPVGVDIELLSDKLNNVAPKILTEKESAEFALLEDAEKLAYLGEKWTQKESIFKSLDKDAFVPGKIETSEHKTYVKSMEMGEGKFALSVATETPERVRFYQNVDYLD